MFKIPGFFQSDLNGGLATAGNFMAQRHIVSKSTPFLAVT